MNLPKKIDPDNLKETVVEIKYLSELPFEILVGIFFNAFDKSFNYTNRPLQQNPMGQGVPGSLGQEIIIKVGVPSLFFNEKISILVSPNTFVFNCLAKYIGWEDYRIEIDEALKKLMSTGHIKQCTRIGLRYISEYSDRDLKDCIKYDFTFGLPDIQSETSAFRSEFMYKEIKVILNLNNKVPVVKQQSSTKQTETIKTSIIDIDIIAEKQETKTLKELLSVIENNHTIEKEIFFGMLKEDYLQSLQPQY